MMHLVTLALLTGPAHADEVAPGWHHTLVNEATFDADNSTFVASAVRQWGPTNQVFVVTERRASTLDHTLLVDEYTCTDAPCSTSTHSTVADEDLLGATSADLMHLPGVALRRHAPSGHMELHITHNTDGPFGCADSTDYIETVWRTDVFGWGGSLDVWMSTAPGDCRKSGQSLTKYWKKKTWACFTQKTPSATEDRVRCGGVQNPSPWTTALIDSPALGVQQDHPEFVFGPTAPAATRAVAYHQWEGASHEVRVRFIDDLGTPTQVYAADVDHVSDRPSADISLAEDRLGVVWEHRPAAGPTGWEIQYGDCTTLAGCLDPGGPGDTWSASSVVHSGTRVRRPEFRSSGSAQFVVFLEETTDGEDDAILVTPQDRVHFTYRCSPADP
ncbi:MAG: hypothetical protein ACI9K2_001283 [Myxococcota bacterium]|jgi:hypothetical protein